MKSNFADLKNAGKDRYGGASKGAAFLEYFINKETNWVHLDIAGPSSSSSQGVCVSEGATGYGTQLILKYLYNYIRENNSSDEKSESNIQSEENVIDKIVAEEPQIILPTDPITSTEINNNEEIRLI